MKNINTISRELIMEKMESLSVQELVDKLQSFSTHLFNKHYFSFYETYLNDIPDHDLKKLYLHLHEKYPKNNS